MSILDNDNNQNRPAVPSSVIASNRLKQLTRQTYQQMVSAFNMGSQIFWANRMGANPQDIANELGSDAKEVFELHYKLGQLIASVKPEAITEGTSVIGNFTMNENGTVTVIEPENPVSE